MYSYLLDILRCLPLKLYRSYRMKSVNAVFKPIRFGEAPVGNLRWKAPILVTDYQEPIQGHLDEKPMCSQPKPAKAGSGGQEDCLFLQIQVQKSVLENKQKIPVLFYIHGGGFVGGTGMGSQHLSVKVSSTNHRRIWVNQFILYHHFPYK